MNLVDLVYQALSVLHRKNSEKYYPSIEVWLYLEDESKKDLIELGYDLTSFTHFDLDKEILQLLGDNNGIPFRVQKEYAEDGSVYCFYWIP